MTRLWRAWIVLLSISVLTACAAATPTPTSEAAAITPAASPLQPTATEAATRPPAATGQPTATPTASPTPTQAPPALSRPLAAPDALAQGMPVGLADTTTVVRTVPRGAIISAAVHPTEPLLALGRPDGAYVCAVPSDPEGSMALTCEHFLPHERWVGAVAFSPDGTRLATVDRQDTLRLWDWAADPPRAETLARDVATYEGRGSLMFTPQGGYLLLAYRDTVQAWALDAGSTRALRLPEAPNRVVAFTVGPDEHTLVMLDDESQMWALDLEAPRQGWQLWYTAREYSDPIGVVAVETPDGPVWLAVWRSQYSEVYVVQGTPDGEWQEVSLPSEPVALRVGNSFGYRPLWTVAPGPDGLALLSDGYNRLYLYDPVRATTTQMLELPAGRTNFTLVRVAYDANTDQVLAAWEDGLVAVWDVSSGELVGLAGLPLSAGTDVGLDPFQRATLFTASPFTVFFNERLQQVGLGKQTAANRLMVPSTGCHIVYALLHDFTSSTVLLRCMLVPEMAAEIPLPEAAYDLPPVSLPATDWVAVVEDDTDYTQVEIWDLFAGQRVQVLDVSAVGRAVSLAAGPDGRWLLVGGTEGRVGWWDPMTGDAGPVWTVDAPPTEGASGYETDDDITALTSAANGQVALIRGDGLLVMATFTPEGLQDPRFLDLTALPNSPYYGGSAHVIWLALSPDARFALTTTEYASSVAIADLEAETFVGTVEGRGMGGSYLPVALAPDGRSLVMTGAERAAVTHDLGPVVARALDGQVLPLPLPAYLAPDMASYQSRYTVTLTVDDTPHTLLDVQAAYTRSPWQFTITTAGEGWHVEGEFTMDYAHGTVRYQGENLALEGDVPPSEPVLRGWPWQYAGLRDGLHRYTSTDPQAAQTPAPTWLRRVLQAQAAGFRPDTFRGEVALRDDGTLMQAHLTWTGTVWADDQTYPAQVEVVYEVQAGATAGGASSDEAASATPTAAADQAWKTDATTGLPVPSEALLAGAESGVVVYHVEWDTEQAAAWYDEVLPQAGYFIQRTGPVEFSGLVFEARTVSRDGALYDVMLGDAGGTTMIVLVER